jgi:SpoVK/Ycf46/Vps4 family AAA+-type ATPase
MTDETYCYVCKEDGWQTMNDNYVFEHPERLSELLTAPFPDLRSIIEICTVYQNFENEVADTMKKYHRENCLKCPSCSQRVSKERRLRLSHKSPLSTAANKEIYCDFTEAICYFGNLNAVQFGVLEKLKSCTSEIQEIENMIGMENIKQEFARVMKYLATYEQGCKEPLMHMGIYGPPGHGKTQIARLIGKAFSKSGLLTKSDVFVLATRADLIGAYCGHTAKNTTKMFDSARGGVIFIDEIYSLGNPEKSDVFTKECIDTINQLLSERTDTLCIIAGYENEAEESFFSYNPGLARRFPFNFVIKPYTETELVKIFTKLAKEDGWDVSSDAFMTTDLSPADIFNNAGGDMENLLVKSIMAHYENNFLSSLSVKSKCLTRDDVLKGIEAYKLNKKTGKSDKKAPPPGMYA